MTGGKMRDTLAGVYDDRAARRFAYTPIGSALVLAAALAMLLGVAARRLGTPAFVTKLAAYARSAPERRAAKEAARARERMRAAEQVKTQAALVERKRAAAANAPQPQGPGILGNLGALPKGPPPPLTPLPPMPPPEAPGPPLPAPDRPLTAAERLAQKRRERR
jgi:hypothetical protein